MRFAIIGTGISGSLIARLLSSRHDVTVFESNDYLGGHAHTVDVLIQGKTFPVDTGFMVFNQRTYPNFCRLLEILKIDSQPSDMSFSVRCAKTGWEYQGSSLNGLFAQRLNVLRPRFLRMLWDISRFNRYGMAAAADGSLLAGQSVGQFVRERGLGRAFVEQYLVPMSAAIWSSEPKAILDFPAQFMIEFFANHGLMQIRDRPTWRTIVGGSRRYVHALLRPLLERVRLQAPVASVERTPDAVLVTPVHGATEHFDEVVFASHADQSLRMLADPTPAEHEILSAFPYQANEAILHTDVRLLPQRPRAWASWNYHIPPGGEQAASVTYDLSRLQNHASGTPILLTLNTTAEIAPAKILSTFTYQHPAYSHQSLIAQRRHSEISGHHRTHYCGAYWGYGFHEDGVNSALAVAKHFGLTLDACTVVSTKEPSRTAAMSL